MTGPGAGWVKLGWRSPCRLLGGGSVGGRDSGRSGLTDVGGRGLARGRVQQAGGRGQQGGAATVRHAGHRVGVAPALLAAVAAL